MLFNSFDYLIFFPTVAAVYFLIPFRYRWAWLLAASYFFYASWNVKYLALILISTLVPYFIGLALARTQTRGRRQALLLLSLCASLGLLFSFKYWNFASESIDAALALLGMDPRAPRLDVYRDRLHLTGEGARILSSLVPDELARRLGGPL